MAFSWKLLYDRIPTKNNLSKRNVLNQNTSPSCVLCKREPESSNHLFLHCEVIREVRGGLFRWLGFHFLTPPNLYIQWECWNDGCRNKRIRKGYWLKLPACLFYKWSWDPADCLFCDAGVVRVLRLGYAEFTFAAVCAFL